jgi:16S rRNA (guanine527-N7)-methyltransferase
LRTVKVDGGLREELNQDSGAVGGRLNVLLSSYGIIQLNPEQTIRFAEFYSLILRWNAKLNLTAIRNTERILSRHFVESIACAQALPSGIASLLDFGSGAGFPGIPIALCRPDISVTLAESQGKKAAFLQEAVRVLGISAKVHSGRAESLDARFDSVVLRAVDRMPKAVRAASNLVVSSGWLAVMTTNRELPALEAAVGEAFSWRKVILLPESEERVLALGLRQDGNN